MKLTDSLEGTQPEVTGNVEDLNRRVGNSVDLGGNDQTDDDGEDSGQDNLGRGTRSQERLLDLLHEGELGLLGLRHVHGGLVGGGGRSIYADLPDVLLIGRHCGRLGLLLQPGTGKL